MSSVACYYCGNILRIQEAKLTCSNVLCKLFGEQQLTTKDVTVITDTNI
jgi:hypothetical protein